MTLPIWPIGIALFLLGAGLYLLAYRRHWNSWTAEQRQEFLTSLAVFTAVAVMAPWVATETRAYTLEIIQHISDPKEIKVQEWMGQILSLACLALGLNMPIHGLQFALNRLSPVPEPVPAKSPEELFHGYLPRLLGGVALLLILAVTGQVLEETRLLDSGLATSSSILYMGLAISGLGLLLQLYAQVNAARQNAALAAGGLLMTLGLGAALCLPQLMGGNTRAEYLIILAGMSVLTVSISTGNPTPQPEVVSVSLIGPTNITTPGTQVWTTSTSAGVTSVHFYLDGTDLGVDNAAPFQVSPSFSAAQNGTHTLKAVATTAQGTQGSTAITLNVNIAGTPPQPQPGQIFIPAAGAAVGSGDGTQFGTVYVSPNQQEVDFMVLLNEVRTKGTLNGVDVRAGTCLAGVQPGTLKPLTYNGVLAYPARKHSTYLGTWGYEGHYENNPSHPAFYGQNPSDRIYRAYNELGVSTANIATGGEIVNANLDAGHWSISSFLNSPAHCQILAQAEIKSIGVGFYTNNQPHHSNGSLTVYPNNWTVLFGR